tara:strand:- start:60 stop:593 length:534 start_codon:yes stop_codon:yes gene_type:complete
MAVTFHPNGKIEGINNSNFNSSLSSGHVIQVVTAVKDNASTYGGTSYTDISGLSATISGVKSGSKIKVHLNIHVGYNCNGQNFLFKLFRDSTFLPHSSGASETFFATEYSAGTNYNDMMYNLSFTYFDTHGQSAGSNLVYKIQGNSNSGGCTTYVNRLPNSSTVRAQSLLTLTEITA